MGRKSILQELKGCVTTGSAFKMKCKMLFKCMKDLFLDFIFDLHAEYLGWKFRHSHLVGYFKNKDWRGI